MRPTAAIKFLALLVGLTATSACLLQEDEMALPISRDTTYAPGSQVKSADLNDIQDQIIANNTRLNGGAGAQVVLAIAPSAPDYHVTGAQSKRIPATAGIPGHSGTAWLASLGVVSTSTDPVDWVVPIETDQGETMNIFAEYSMTNAVSGGYLNLTFAPSVTGSPSVVASVAIPSIAGRHRALVVASHTVGIGYYSLQFNFAGGHGGVDVIGAEKTWTR